MKWEVRFRTEITISKEDRKLDNSSTKGRLQPAMLGVSDDGL
jgi:hypothetical protein